MFVYLLNCLFFQNLFLSSFFNFFRSLDFTFVVPPIESNDMLPLLIDFRIDKVATLNI